MAQKKSDQRGERGTESEETHRAQSRGYKRE